MRNQARCYVQVRLSFDPRMQGEFCHPEQHNALNAAVLSGNRGMYSIYVLSGGFRTIQNCVA